MGLAETEGLSNTCRDRGESHRFLEQRRDKEIHELHGAREAFVTHIDVLTRVEREEVDARRYSDSALRQAQGDKDVSEP